MVSRLALNLLLAPKPSKLARQWQLVVGNRRKVSKGFFYKKVKEIWRTLRDEPGVRWLAAKTDFGDWWLPDQKVSSRKAAKIWAMELPRRHGKYSSHLVGNSNCVQQRVAASKLQGYCISRLPKSHRRIWIHRLQRRSQSKGWFILGSNQSVKLSKPQIGGTPAIQVGRGNVVN